MMEVFMTKQTTWVTAVLVIALFTILSACATNNPATLSLPAESGISEGNTATAPVAQPAAAVAVETIAEAETAVAETAVSADMGSVSRGNGNAGTGLNSALVLTAVGDLTDAEIDGLLYMREEEKLAHDVYVTLYEMWGLPVFSNIASSEQMHTDTVLAVLTQYNLDDPAAGLGVGEFANPDLQALYNQLVSQGSQSVADAVLVGGLIEETDILDLQAEIGATTQATILQIYQNLLDGSANHLSSFAAQYTRQTGETYTAQLLSPEELAALLQNTPGNGQGGQGQGGQGQGSNGQGGQGQNRGQGRGQGTGQS